MSRACWHSRGPQRIRTSWSSRPAMRRASAAQCSARPLLGRPVGAARIQGDDAAVAAQPQVAPDRVAHATLRRRDRQLQLRRFGRAAGGPGQGEITLDHGRRHDPSPLAGRKDLAAQQRAAAVADVADPLLGPAQPGQQRRVERIGQAAGSCRTAPAAAAARRAQRRCGGLLRAGIEVPLLVEPGGAVQQRAQVRPQDADQPGRRAEVPPQRAERGRGHHQVAEPVGKENADVHGGKTPVTRRSVCARGRLRIFSIRAVVE